MFGIRVRDGSGNIVFDAYNAIGRLLGTVNTGGSDGYVDTNFAGGTPIVQVYATDSGTDLVAPSWTVSGNRLSWSYGGATRKANATIIFGVA